MWATRAVLLWPEGHGNVSDRDGIPCRSRDRVAFFHHTDARSERHGIPSRSGDRNTMNVIALTVFVGLLLVTFFVILWIATAVDSRQFSERDALLPLEPDSSPTRKTDS
jgi:hypothetical protein